MLASLSSALTFSWRSGKASAANVTRGLDLDFFGRPLRLERSAGPRSLSGTWHRCWPLIPHGSANRDGPGAAAGNFSLIENEEEDMVSAAMLACSGSLRC